jgi:hypothetical protein
MNNAIPPRPINFGLATDEDSRSLLIVLSVGLSKFFSFFLPPFFCFSFFFFYGIPRSTCGAEKTRRFDAGVSLFILMKRREGKPSRRRTYL